MDLKRILCPIDFSQFNAAANEYASMLASESGGRIIYFHTFLPDPVLATPALFDADAKQKRLLDKMKEEFFADRKRRSG